MQTYLVGGAVRDKLLGLVVHDHDWVVVGTTPESMIKKGFKPVGKDFPVFLHPETNEEYALARTERKLSKGYHGFSFNAATDVTLKDDLARRDLTINALAEDADGNIIDYYQGKSDLEKGILRHVSIAFAEDPVRVLRVARFAARYAALGFTIAPETMQLMQQMVAEGEVDALVAERVWQETEKALAESRADVFFTVLRECNALAVLFPEIDQLFGVPQKANYHPEIDTGIHAMMVLQQAVKLSSVGATRFAALTHDLGKATTPTALLPCHPEHEERSCALIQTLCERYKVPKAYYEIATITARYHTEIHRAFDLSAERIVHVLDHCDVLRKPERFSQLLLACEADSKGRTGYEKTPYPQRLFYEQAADLYRHVDVQAIIAAGYSGAAIKQQLQLKRVQALAAHCAKHHGTTWS